MGNNRFWFLVRHYDLVMERKQLISKRTSFHPKNKNCRKIVSSSVWRSRPGGIHEILHPQLAMGVPFRCCCDQLG